MTKKRRRKRWLDHDKLRRTWDASLGSLMHERGLTLDDAETGAPVRRAPRTREERKQLLRGRLVKVIKGLVHKYPSDEWWDGQKLRRHHVCEWVLKDHPRALAPAIKLFKHKKDNLLSLRTVFGHTDELEKWTRARFDREHARFEQKQAEAEREQAEAEQKPESQSSDPREIYRVEKAKHPQPPQL